MLYWWNKIWDDGTSWMKIYANFASSRPNQLSMLSGNAHSLHRFRAQFLHFHSGRHEHFHPSKKCSLIHTKNRKIRSCWPQLCGLFWHSRNQVHTSPKDYPLSQVAPTAFQALADFLRANSTDASQPRSFSQSRIRWSPPREGEIKVNFDGAQFRDMGKASLGVIIRDCRGQALASLSEQASLPFSSKIVEAMAAARAISVA